MWLVYFILGAFLRRWYGGALENYKILRSRGVQTVAMIGAFLSIYVTDIHDWKNWLVAIAISCWLQWQFWSRGHGCCFDMGYGGYPNEEIKKRYNERWYHIPCDWLAEKRFFSYYGVDYDYFYMRLRYGCPMILMMFFDWKYILIGLAIANIYLRCWQWYNSTVWIKNIPFVGNATQMAEVISGGLVYMGCYLINKF